MVSNINSICVDENIVECFFSGENLPESNCYSLKIDGDMIYVSEESLILIVDNLTCLHEKNGLTVNLIRFLDKPDCEKAKEEFLQSVVKSSDILKKINTLIESF